MTIWNDRAISCVAVSVMSEVASAVQTKIGMRKWVMPFARWRTMVAITFKPPKIDDNPNRYTPKKNICIPSGACALSGG